MGVWGERGAGSRVQCASGMGLAGASLGTAMGTVADKRPSGVHLGEEQGGVFWAEGSTVHRLPSEGGPWGCRGGPDGATAQAL